MAAFSNEKPEAGRAPLVRDGHLPEREVLTGMGPVAVKVSRVWDGEPASILTEAEEATIIAFRRHTLVPLDDCLYSLQSSIPQLTRSALHRYLQ